VGCNPRQDVRQPSLRIDIVHFGRDDEAVHGGGMLTTAVCRRRLKSADICRC
jgi:hypothetical protein